MSRLLRALARCVGYPAPKMFPRPATPATAGAAGGQTTPVERSERPETAGPGEGHKPSRQEFLLGYRDGRTQRVVLAPVMAEKIRTAMHHPSARGNPATPIVMIAAPDSEVSA